MLSAACGGDKWEGNRGGPVMATAGTPAPGLTAGMPSTAAGTPATAGMISIPRAGAGVVAGNPTPMTTAGKGPAGMSGGMAGMIAPPPPAGAGGGMMAGMTGGAAGATMPPPTLPAGDGPPLPAIMGECPSFMNGGTIMAAGHRSIVITSGAMSKGGALLFYWHGTGSSAREAMSTIPAAVRSEITMGGGIIAAFNGNSSSGGGDCSGTGAHGKNDFNAADLIAACAVKNYGIDSRRIYSTGCSAGGLQTGCMAEMRSSYLAAVAPNSGGTVGNQPWQDKHTPAVFTMHGGSSDVVIVTFSQTSATFDMASKSHGGFVVNCNHGGGHCQAPAALQTAAWTFMKAHPWGFADSPWKGGIPMGVPDYCKIF